MTDEGSSGQCVRRTGADNPDLMTYQDMIAKNHRVAQFPLIRLLKFLVRASFRLIRVPIRLFYLALLEILFHVSFALSKVQNSLLITDIEAVTPAFRTWSGLVWAALTGLIKINLGT